MQKRILHAFVGKYEAQNSLAAKLPQSVHLPVADLRGRQGRPPRSKFFHFHAVYLQKNRLAHPLWELARPLGKSWIRHCLPQAFKRMCLKHVPQYHDYQLPDHLYVTAAISATEYSGELAASDLIVTFAFAVAIG